MCSLCQFEINEYFVPNFEFVSQSVYVYNIFFAILEWKIKYIIIYFSQEKHFINIFSEILHYLIINICISLNDTFFKSIVLKHSKGSTMHLQEVHIVFSFNAFFFFSFLCRTWNKSLEFRSRQILLYLYYFMSIWY